MKITIFSTDKACNDLLVFKCCHVTMFEGHKIKFQFGGHLIEEQMKLINVCIGNYVLIEVQGHNVTIVPETKNHQRVRVRFDSGN